MMESITAIEKSFVLHINCDSLTQSKEVTKMKMNMPGFTADASLYKAGRSYRSIKTGQNNQLFDSVRPSAHTASHRPEVDPPEDGGRKPGGGGGTGGGGTGGGGSQGGRGWRIPQRDGCWCTEPDTREVCNSRTGVCVETPVCLQWWCGFPPGDELPDVPVVIVR